MVRVSNPNPNPKLTPTLTLTLILAKVSPLVKQLVGRTAWGELDYLVIDMPPGTADVQLTLAQDFAVSAAVLVTTPQRLSFVDVVKGVEMFDKVWGMVSVRVRVRVRASTCFG